MDVPSTFIHGLRVFFRTQLPDGTLHHYDFLEGRTLVAETRDTPFLLVKSIHDERLAYIHLDSISFILPLTPVGPSSDAQD